MKAVILAAGKSTRTYPLSIDKPKPLLKIAHKSLIVHNMEQLTGLVDELIIIVGYKASVMKKTIGKQFEDMKITYVEQKEQLGTGHALMQAQKYLKGERFLVMMGDDIYFRADMRRCLGYDHAVLAKRVENYSDFGVFTKQGDHVMDLVEKPSTFISDLANTGFYVFTDKIFSSMKTMKKSPRGEYEITDAVSVLAKKEDIFCVEAQVWFPIGYPWNLLQADQILRDDLLVGKNSQILGKVSNSTVGDNCKIEGFVKNCLIGDNVTIRGDSVIEDSIIANDVDFTGTIKSANKVELMIGGKRRIAENFGAVIADGCVLKDVLLNPGTLVWPGIKKHKVELKGIVK